MIMKKDKHIPDMVYQTNSSKKLIKSSRLEIRCTEQDKAVWVKSAKDKKLTEWITEALNREAVK